MDVRVTINLTKLVEKRIQVRSFILLYLLNEEEFEFLKTIYDEDYLKELLTELQTEGYLKIIGDNLPNDIELREKAYDVLAEDNTKDLTIIIRELFPVGIKTGGLPVRSNEKEIQAKLKKFLRTYKYDRETIINATKKYIEEKRAERWAYMKTASYFIFKDTSSVLADYCQSLNEEPSNQDFKRDL